MVSATSSDPGGVSRQDGDATIGYDIRPDASYDGFRRPTSIGRYVVLDLLGVGGMGVVCTAYDPKLDRKIALKLLRDDTSAQDEGHDREASMTAGQARLFREAQALAKLSHPNVITVHDVETHDGQLYITMEYVEGRSLKEWMHEERRHWRQVLDVFLEAGRGLAAAHAAGITHRDFKPANVLLGNDGRVRVVDFGLAKAAGDRDNLEHPAATTGEHVPAGERDIIERMRSATDLTLTRAGRSVGTPAYMAPEQHLGLDTGPATDQFGFCVSLYEALYGQVPFQGDSLEQQFQNVIEGNVREPPDDPEFRVPSWIHRIVLRGLSPQTKQRYPNMDALLAGLANDPARRRRRWLATGIVVLSLGGAAWGMAAARSQRVDLCADADSRFGGTWDDARKAAIEAAFLATGLSYSQDSWQRVRQRLDEHVERWSHTYVRVCEATHVRGEQSQALLDVRMACLQRRLGEIQGLTEAFAQADVDVVRRAAAAVHELTAVEDCATTELVNERDRMPDDPATRSAIELVQTRVAEASGLVVAGRYEAAESRAKDAVELALELPHLSTRADALITLARAQQYLHRDEDAEKGFRAAIRVAAEAGATAHEATAWTHLMYVIGYSLERFEEAAELQFAAETAVARDGDLVERRAKVANLAGAVYYARGKHEKALEAYERAAELERTSRPGDHPYLAGILQNLGATYAVLHRFDEAKTALEECLAIYERTLGVGHPELAGAHLNLGNVLMESERPEEARGHLLRALEIRRETFAADHSSIADVLLALGTLHRRSGRLDEALTSYREAIGILERGKASENRIVSARVSLGKALIALERWDEAREDLQAALGSARKLGPDHPRQASVLLNLCEVERKSRRFREAVRFCEEAVEIRRRAHPRPHPELADALSALGRVLLAADEVDRAIVQFEESLKIHEATAAKPSHIAQVRFELAQALWRAHRRGDALALARSARDGFGPEKASVAEVTAWLADRDRR